MGRFFNRDISVTVGTNRIASRSLSDPDMAKPTLRMRFRIGKTLGKDPNRAELQLWNLRKETRKALQVTKSIPVIIEAGYVGETQQLFSGDMTNVVHSREGNDWITKIDSGDGSKSYRSSRINESFAPGTKKVDVIKRVAETMGVGMGNVIDKLSEGGFRGGVIEFAKGISVVGKCSDVLERLLASAGLEYSIQDGQLQVFKCNSAETTKDEAIILDHVSGLIGAPPEPGDKGHVKARSLLKGTIAPGREVVILPLRSDRMSIRVEKVSHIGDTWGTEWYSDFEGTMK